MVATQDNVQWVTGDLSSGIVKISTHHYVTSRMTGGKTTPPPTQWRTEGGLGEFKSPEVPKDLQNRAKLNPIVKTVKNC